MSRTTPFDPPASASSEAEDLSATDDEIAIEVDDEAEEDEEFVQGVLTGSNDDAIDLKTDQRMAIDLAFDGIDEKSFYEILLLPRTAEPKSIKRSYYRLSKEYHPDKFYRKNLGPYKAKLEVIFNKITEAYRILSDPDARADYDELVFGKEEEQEKAASVTQASTTVTFVPEAEKKRQAAEAVKRAAREEKLKKRSRPVFMQKFGKQLAQRIAKAKAAMKAGKEAAEAENWEEAAAQYQRAMTLDPRNPKAKTAYKRASANHRNAKAENFYRQAQEVMLAEDTKRAAELYQKAVDCKPTKGKYYYEFGKLVLEHTLQQKTALELLRKAVEFEPRNVDYNLELGRVYGDLGMTSRAQSVYERVLKLDKKNSQASKALKRLK